MNKQQVKEHAENMDESIDKLAKVCNQLLRMADLTTSEFERNQLTRIKNDILGTMHPLIRATDFVEDLAND